MSGLQQAPCQTNRLFVFNTLGAPHQLIVSLGWRAIPFVGVCRHHAPMGAATSSRVKRPLLAWRHRQDSDDRNKWPPALQDPAETGCLGLAELKRCYSACSRHDAEPKDKPGTKAVTSIGQPSAYRRYNSSGRGRAEMKGATAVVATVSTPVQLLACNGIGVSPMICTRRPFRGTLAKGATTRRHSNGALPVYCDGASLVLSTQPTLSFSSATSHHSPSFLPVG